MGLLESDNSSGHLHGALESVGFVQCVEMVVASTMRACMPAYHLDTYRQRQTETDRDRQRQTETGGDRQRQTDGRTDGQTDGHYLILPCVALRYIALHYTAYIHARTRNHIYLYIHIHMHA